MVFIVSEEKTSLLNILPLLILNNSISSFVYVLYVTLPHLDSNPCCLCQSVV